jgi:hypothetical protein
MISLIYFNAGSNFLILKKWTIMMKAIEWIRFFVFTNEELKQILISNAITFIIVKYNLSSARVFEILWFDSHNGKYSDIMFA